MRHQNHNIFQVLDQHQRGGTSMNSCVKFGTGSLAMIKSYATFYIHHYKFGTQAIHSFTGLKVKEQRKYLY